jgi:hypothetical protein
MSETMSTTRRAILVALESMLALLTIAFGLFALMFVQSEMAGPAAAYAFVAGVLSVRTVVRIWRLIS